MAWQDELLPASFRGIPFGVERVAIRPGRQTAVHSYPYRDDIWAEDLGKLRAPFRVTGFLVEGDPYSIGLPVFLQRDLFKAACEQAGIGILIHPSLGALNVVLIGGCELTEDAQKGGEVSLSFQCIESVPSPIYPTGAANTANGITLGSLNLDTSSITAFASSVSSAAGTAVAAVQGALSTGFAVAAQAVATVSAFVAPILSAVQSARLVIDAVTGVAGLVGRYAGGSRTTLQPATETVETLIAAATTARTVTAAACAAAVAVAGDLGGATTAQAQATSNATVTAIQAAVEAVRTGAADPGTAILLLTALVGFTSVPLAGGDAIGAAMTTVASAAAGACRRAALSSIGRAVSTYQPSSLQDAITMRGMVCGLIDGEILLSDYATSLALRGLRTAVVTDLNARSQSLASVVTVTEPMSRPALAVAYSLYQDASRYDELVARVDPISPNFMPVTFEALAS